MLTADLQSSQMSSTSALTLLLRLVPNS